MKKLVAKTGEYTNQAGETKGRYTTIGVIMSNQNGEYAIIDPTVNLAGVLMKQRLANPQKAGDSVICSIFDNDRQPPSPKPAGDDFDDDIPF